MARRNKGTTAKSTLGPKLGLLVTTAAATLALAGCATASAPPAEMSFAKAQAALDGGQVDSAIQHAEAAVLADPRNAGYRAMLGAAYLEAGRFESAATAFGESLELGNSDPRTVLSYALAKVATGDNQGALGQLYAHQDQISPADLGLALSLAGQPDRGVQYLINAVRQGENTAKSRQNLAYSYALAGNWRAARVMAAEDVPADQLETRLAEWAATARPEDYQIRVANLLGVRPSGDNGQPQHLALANFPEMATMTAAADVATDAAPVALADAGPARVRESEAMLFGIDNIDTADAAAPEVATARYISEPTIQRVNPTPAPPAAPVRSPVRVAQAQAQAPTPVPAPAASPAAEPVRMPTMAAASSGGMPRFVSNAVVQDVPAPAPRAAAAPTPTRAAAPAPAPQQRRAAVATGAAATHLIQLGSFDNRQIAEAKWAEFQRRFPDLAGRDAVFTEAQVNGRTYFRVAAAGFGAGSARSVCNTVKAGGLSCFAYAANSPPAGAVDRGVRVASR